MWPFHRQTSNVTRAHWGVRRKEWITEYWWRRVQHDAPVPSIVTNEESDRKKRNFKFRSSKTGMLVIHFMYSISICLFPSIDLFHVLAEPTLYRSSAAKSCGKIFLAFFSRHSTQYFCDSFCWIDGSNANRDRMRERIYWTKAFNT